MGSRRRELVLITGSGGALGRLFALELSKHGAELVLWDINGETNERRQQGGQAHAYTVDVTNREQVYRTANQVRKEVGRCDLLGEQRRGAGRRETPGLNKGHGFNSLGMHELYTLNISIDSRNKDA
uniref:Uncharacterized protein n=1 Tax=Cyprinus carpio carpio TaxID=630221 RepID=A0A8C1G1E6_CYPCA